MSDDKIGDILNSVADNFTKALKQENLEKLLERKTLLMEKMANPEITGIDRANNRLQIRDIDRAIALLQSEVSLADTYDIEIDEVAAREFLQNLDVEFDDVNFVESNDTLDELEKSLGLKKGD